VNHLRVLLEHGTLSDVARASSVPFHTLRSLNEDPSPDRTVTRAIAESIVATTPGDVTMAAEVKKSPARLAKIRKHVVNLLAVDGCKVDEIAAVSGVPESTILDILAGRQTTILIETVEALTGVTAAACDVLAGAVSAERAVTRLRSLQANGWPLDQMSALLGHDVDKIIDSRRIPVEVDEDVATLYEWIEEKPGGDAAAADEAMRLGFHAPVHYDDSMRLMEDSIPGWVTAADIARQERDRTGFRILAFTLRGYTEAQLLKALDTTSGTVESTRRRARLRMFPNRGQLDPLLAPGQDAAVAIIEKYLRPIAIRERTDVLDDPGLDYEARWKAMCAELKALRAAARQSELTQAA
jgi:DNA-directed RNA polymerase specialized sigma24 family protein